MKNLDEKESARLVSLIYGTSMNKNWNTIQDKKNVNTVADLIDEMEESVKTHSPDLTRDKEGNIKYGGEMTREEFLDVIEQIRASDTLMRMEIKDITDNEDTNFRAMTLEDPEKDPEKKVKPIIVFRGTAGDYQWGDNSAAMFSTQTPSQREAAKYVANSGLDHVTLAGHSKGGNMAASCAYLLPEGMVDKVYSYDGQGASKTFLNQIGERKQKFCKSIIYNINEFRDAVSQIFTKTGSDKNTIYFDSGVDYYNADLPEEGFDFKMYFFHTHKSNYFLKTGLTLMNRTFVPARIANQISMWNGLDALPESLKLKIAKKVAGLMYTNESDIGQKETEWSNERWEAVLRAEEVYAKVKKSREDEMCQRLAELYHVDFSKFKLDQDPTSFVVEGAILTCDGCNNIGELKNIEDHSNIIQGKAVASKKDNKAGTNILIENAECMLCAVDEIESVLKNPETDKKTLESAGTVTCKPEICREWVITDPSIIVDVEGQEVPAVLKKSMLPCLKGGIITVAHNGQIIMSDIEKMSLEESISKKWEQTPKALQKVAAIYTSGLKGEIDRIILTPKKVRNNIKNQIDLGIDMGETLMNGCIGLKNGIESGIVKVGEALDEAIQQLEQAKDNYLQDYLWKQVQGK
ncbi:Mbeg1-like protein [Lacrimispora indolis]|uniref:Mbeg1-like protein n=1 Tax=Lacrimispora indolis TaxID=69825 RepID=UPI0004274027|nr:PAAR-like protein [[Clostridium] methoxybenzovorans]